MAVGARRAAHRDEPARRPRVRRGVRRADLRVHGRRSSAWRSFGFFRAAHRRPAPGRERRSRRSCRSRATTALGGFALVFLLLRAFSSGCAALTGVEAISNGVPAFKKPKSKNAATTLLLMGVIAVTMLLSIITLARMDRRQVSPRTRRPSCTLDGLPVGDELRPGHVIGQLSQGRLRRLPARRRASSRSSPALILVLAANTAFNGFPVLGSILAQDGYLPRQLHTRGDRLAFSNGILILAGAAAVLIVLLQRRGHQADPALHRRRLRLVHAEPDRHDPALEPAPARSSATRRRAAG